MVLIYSRDMLWYQNRLLLVLFDDAHFLAENENPQQKSTLGFRPKLGPRPLSLSPKGNQNRKLDVHEKPRQTLFFTYQTSLFLGGTQKLDIHHSS